MANVYFGELVNFKNYLMYANDISAGNNIIRINVDKDITRNNIEDHIVSIHNILKDGIELDYVHNLRINLNWDDGINCNLSIFDYWINLFAWSGLLNTDQKIRPKNIFFKEHLRVSDIAEYIDRFILTSRNKEKYDNYYLNEVIDDCIWPLSYSEDFALYFANTINNEDNIDLMNASDEYDALMHKSFANIPFEKVKDEGQKVANETIDFIINSKDIIGYTHGLANSFRAREAINARQYKESIINIGTKAIDDSAIPIIIDSSFANGGVNKPEYLFSESSSARDAQIKSKNNVGDSGDLARIVNLNNIDTIFNKNMHYVCNSMHFIGFEIKSKKHLKSIVGRRYRKNRNGIQHIITGKENDLIGTKIYLKSPMTCASNSSGLGICKGCYGDLYHTNIDINPGVIAVEILTSKLTQRLLSAKHISETIIKALKWNSEFKLFFDVDINCIVLSSTLEDEIPNYNKYTMLIDPESIVLISDEEDAIKTDDDVVVTYNEYITSFKIKTPNGEIIDFGTEENTQLYISKDLNSIIRKNASKDDDFISIPLSSLEDMQVFYIRLINNPLTKALYDIIDIIDKGDVTYSLNMEEALQKMADLVIEVGFDISLVHLEVILSNQIFTDNVNYNKPNWNNPNEEAILVTLNHALTNNKSPIISMLYKDLNKVFYNPLTFTKNAPSFLDMFFMEQPQLFMKSDMIIDRKDSGVNDPQTKLVMCKIVDKEEKEA